MRVRVVGIGTRHGDDVAGLLVAEQLARAPLPPEVRVHTCERSPLDLIEALADADAAILVDATRSGRSPGTVRRVHREDLQRRRPTSTHGFGVAEALALVEALDAAPPYIELVGIEGAATSGEEVSPAVAGAVAAACDLVRALVSQWLATGRRAETGRPVAGQADMRCAKFSQ